MAAFKKYVGMVSGAVQRYIDANLGKCPFCGEAPDWTADADAGVKSSYNFRCAKCGAVLSVPTASIVNPFKVMPENMTAVSTGAVNANSLRAGTTYSVQFLIAGGLRLGDAAAVKRDIASATQPAPAVQKPEKSGAGKRALLVLLLLALLAGAVAITAVNAPKRMEQMALPTEQVSVYD